jgi:glycosyltransferase involved in cell wall biosynthesis
MSDRGHDVRVLTTDFRKPGVGADASHDDVHRELRWYWRDHDWPRLALRTRFRIERHNARLLTHHLERFRPHVVSWWAMGGMSMSLIERVRRAGLPAVGVVGDEWMGYAPWRDGWSRLVRQRLRASGLIDALTGIPTGLDLDHAATWLFNSELTRQRALAAGWTLPRARVLHPGVDHDLFQPRPLKEWRHRLVYLGRIDARKGIATAVRALALMDPEATLSVVGEGDAEHLDGLHRLAAELGLLERVAFRRVPREDVPECLAGADALVFPVLWEEPWGLVPLEAMAVGTPIVATGTGGSGEYLRHEQNCLLFEPRDDPGALAAGVRRLAEDAALRQQLRTEGLRTAARFDERAYNEAILEELEHAASGAAPPPPSRRSARAGLPS